MRKKQVKRQLQDAANCKNHMRKNLWFKAYLVTKRYRLVCLIFLIAAGLRIVYSYWRFLVLVPIPAAMGIGAVGVNYGCGDDNFHE